MAKISNPRPSDYAKLNRFLEESYGHSFNHFPSIYPHSWKKHNTDFENIFIIQDRGAIVSLLRFFPLETVQSGARIKLAGIGNIATAYSHRGRGYMAELLKHSFTEMKKRKIPLSVLSGDRHRYGNFGYENGGRNIEISISARGLEKNGVQPLGVKRYEGDEKVLEKIIDTYNLLTCRKERKPEEFREIYTRYGTALYYMRKGRDFAYAAISIDRAKIMEFGGSNELVPCILKYLNERFGYSSFSLSFPDFGYIPSGLFSLASSWIVSPGLMIKIINLAQTLKIFSGQAGFLFPDNEEITLSIKNKESAVISKISGNLRIHAGKGRNEIILDEKSMVRLLFGVSFWTPENTEEKAIRILKQFLPFNLFLGRFDRI